MPGTHRTRRYRRGDGTPVSGYTARNPERRRASTGVTVTLTAAVTVGFLTLTGSLPLTEGAAAGGSEGASVEVSVDLNKAVAALAAHGFHSTHVVSPSHACATNSTGSLRHFFARHRCEDVILAGLTAHGHGTTTRVAISWVTMPSARLATQYKNKVDTYGTGNPPEPAGKPSFNGLCYASGQEGAVVWAAQVQPIGHPSVSADRKILRDTAPGKLNPSYLQHHCID